MNWQTTYKQSNLIDLQKELNRLLVMRKNFIEKQLALNGIDLRLNLILDLIIIKRISIKN